MDLAFEDAELGGAEREPRSELRLRSPAEDKEVDQRADDGVEEAQDHGPGSWRSGRGDRSGRPGRGGCGPPSIDAIIGSRAISDDSFSFKGT